MWYIGFSHTRSPHQNPFAARQIPQIFHYLQVGNLLRHPVMTVQDNQLEAFKRNVLEPLAAYTNYGAILAQESFSFYFWKVGSPTTTVWLNAIMLGRVTQVPAPPQSPFPKEFIEAIRAASNDGAGAGNQNSGSSGQGKKYTLDQINKAYDVLGVKPDMPFDNIKKAYRKLALDNHPDRVSDEAEREVATKKMQQINHAFDVLKAELTESLVQKILENILRKSRTL